MFGVPLHPSSAEASELRESMRAAWIDAGEPAGLFPARFGERIFEVDAPFADVRAFYLPFVREVFMDHAAASHDHDAGFPQDLFTALLTTSDGTLVKLTVSRPFYRFPDRRRIDRTVIQVGRVGKAP